MIVVCLLRCMCTKREAAASICGCCLRAVALEWLQIPPIKGLPGFENLAFSAAVVVHFCSMHVSLKHQVYAICVWYFRGVSIAWSSLLFYLWPVLSLVLCSA